MSKYGKRSWGTGGPSPKRMRQSDRILNQAHRNYSQGRNRGCAMVLLAVGGAATAIVTFAATARGLL